MKSTVNPDCSGFLEFNRRLRERSPLGNPFRVATNVFVVTQGSALARATLGWNLLTPSAFAMRHFGEDSIPH
jgi:hypothetical protein